MLPTPRQTKARLAVERIFQAYPRPLSLEELCNYVKVKLPATAYSTIFRIVKKLEQEKKITPVDWRERGSRYEWIEGGDHHHHIVCQVCGKIADIGDADVNFDERKIQRATGYTMKHHTIELEGVCGGCQRKS